MSDALATDLAPDGLDGEIALRLPVRHREVTVVGAEDRALSVVGALVAAGAVVTVVSPRPPSYLFDLADRGLITLRDRDFHPADIDMAELLFAYTGIPDTDHTIAELARQQGVFCIGSDRSASRRDSPATVSRGRVIIVGGGPGDPGLLTVAGRAALAGADVIVTDRLAPVGALHEIAPRAQIIDASKIPGGRRTEQYEINAMLIEHALAGRTVVRLKGGDGFVFGRGGEEADECVRAGVTVEVIPGVSSAIAAPAAALIPVTHRGLTQGFTVVSGHVPPDHPDCTVDYAALARTNTTIVLMMAVGNLNAITRALIDAGMPDTTPAAVIADGTLAGQRELRGDLGTIAAAAHAAGVRPPATTVIGAVAGFVAGRAARPVAAQLSS
ncbi:uroporphyrinogen-III C-methyltransferase [Mycolicibacterium fluoranthenivorans]|uniref:uroporphyrinogen-III C-methyltransferase n=1 Tax=Mycolicibacterium fluoranthenivorans TaxID=258505 RepID=A0A1G4WY35_9MYCO|nr:uroporphyrinogen-III C-methyltransferase [Mycolicibacterium fluoranthenivorans]SCX31090.1 uroporphyrin-III C-methyltransferase / precorrin-2 dehydrogenase / sirohydrochlorin ferrochelatase [Mycolicibacterium fluoranthenivorans]